MNSSNTISPIVLLNNQACALLHGRHYRAAFGLLKDAMAMLKGQISYGGQYSTLLQTMPQKPHEAATLSRFEQHQRIIQNQQRTYWIYTEPLWAETDAPMDETFLVFVLTFNLALSCHLLAIQLEQEGEIAESQQAFLMTKQLYALPIKLVQTSHNDLCHDDFDPYVYAGILNNVSHVHTSLQEEQPAFAYRTQLIKSLFFYADRKINNTLEAIQCFQCFMENVDDLVLDPVASAAAA